MRSSTSRTGANRNTVHLRITTDCWNEVCGCGTLLADQDGLYDPRDYNDRLLLGIKGTLSEAELHILRQRMHQGRLNKAKRGELFNHPPIGYKGMKLQEIAAELTRRGVPTKTGKSSRWTHQAVARILDRAS